MSGRRPRGLSLSRRYVLGPITTPRARAAWRQRQTRRTRVLYCLRVNRPGNWRHSSSKSCVALMLGSSSNRLHAIGHTMRNAWTRAVQARRRPASASAALLPTPRQKVVGSPIGTLGSDSSLVSEDLVGFADIAVWLRSKMSAGYRPRARRSTGLRRTLQGWVGGGFSGGG